MLLLLVASCTPNKEVAMTPERPMPDWVRSRPINPAYYIGVGSVSKRIEPVEYTSVAKKNALNDLTSEIRVTVKSESFLNTMQVNKQVQEEFNSTIATFSDEEIEGFEIVDNYETETDYWVFYRLSKARHEQIRQEKKTAVMRAAYDHLQRARQAREDANVTGAADAYLRGLFEMKEYWNDVNRFSENGNDIYLDNQIFQEFKSLVSKVELAVEPAEIMLNADNSFSQEVRVYAKLDGKPVSSLPVTYTYDNGKYRNEFERKTDGTGALTIQIGDADLAKPNNQLEVFLTATSLEPQDLDRKLMDPLVEGTRSSTTVVPIRTELPSVFFKVKEFNLGEDLGTERLAAPLREAMSNKGFRFTTSEEKADYIVTIEGATREGGTSQGFHVAYLDVDYAVSDRKGNMLLQNSENNIKGLQLNSKSAGLEAYKKASKRIEKEIVDDILDAIF